MYSPNEFTLEGAGHAMWEWLGSSDFNLQNTDWMSRPHKLETIGIDKHVCPRWTFFQV
jgi:hypothetical protein